MAKITYSPKLIEFLQRHWNRDLTDERLAQLIGTPVMNLRNAVCRLRKRGYEFAPRKTDADGTISIRATKEGGTHQFIKENGKWVYIRGSYKPPKEGERKTPRKTAKHARPTQDTTPTGKVPPRGSQAARIDSRSPTRHTRTKNPVENGCNPDKMKVKKETGGRWLKLDHRTTVYRISPL